MFNRSRWCLFSLMKISLILVVYGENAFCTLQSHVTLLWISSLIMSKIMARNVIILLDAIWFHYSYYLFIFNLFFLFLFFILFISFLLYKYINYIQGITCNVSCVLVPFSSPCWCSWATLPCRPITTPSHLWRALSGTLWVRYCRILEWWLRNWKNFWKQKWSQIIFLSSSFFFSFFETVFPLPPTDWPCRCCAAAGAELCCGALHQAAVQGVQSPEQAAPPGCGPAARTAAAAPRCPSSGQCGNEHHQGHGPAHPAHPRGRQLQDWSLV